MWRSRYPGIAKSKDQDQSLKTMMIMSATASTSHCSQSAASAEGGLVGGRQPEERSAVVAGGRDGPTSADSHCLPSFSPWHMCRLGFGRLDKLFLKKIEKNYCKSLSSSFKRQIVSYWLCRASVVDVTIPSFLSRCASIS